MLTRIDVRSENAFFVPTIGATPKDSLLIRKVTGLTPPDISLFIGDYSRDGGIYQGRRVGNRNVVITFDMNPNPALGETVAGLREMLYKAFIDPQTESDDVKLELRDDLGRVLYLVGYTEKFETEMFDIETMAQISIICPDPYIRDNVETVLAHATGWTVVPFTYTGTAETGFYVEIKILSDTSVLTLDNNGQPYTGEEGDPNRYRGRMIIYTPLLTNDIVRINTVRGQRSIMHYPAAVPDSKISLISSLDSHCKWLELHSQSNVLQVYGTDDNDQIAVIKQLKYTQAYWGI